MNDGPNILYAEDDEFMRLTVSECLNFAFPKATLEICNDGVSLERKLKQGLNGTNLILTDNQMPGPNGSDLIRMYARLPAFENIPFILYYGGFPEIGKKAVSEGAFDYLIKPVREEELIGLVKKALKIE